MSALEMKPFEVSEGDLYCICTWMPQRLPSTSTAWTRNSSQYSASVSNTCALWKNNRCELQTKAVYLGVTDKVRYLKYVGVNVCHRLLMT